MTARPADAVGPGDDAVTGGQVELAGGDRGTGEPADGAERGAGGEVEVAGFAPGGGEEDDLVRGAPIAAQDDL